MSSSFSDSYMPISAVVIAPGDFSSSPIALLNSFKSPCSFSMVFLSSPIGKDRWISSDMSSSKFHSSIFSSIFIFILSFFFHSISSSADKIENGLVQSVWYRSPNSWTSVSFSNLQGTPASINCFCSQSSRNSDSIPSCAKLVSSRISLSI
ncbi:predicted protein [Clavispora lusitaniae ATCC 42720]|uniref:Uncharacterized protein n=1 Tax=Clavispora lusitaniae (strain ATCC 42720) TaxID=306902 RepID=C4YAH3_CLAL4|nr:uncharacterized protein CLUG_05111 [Clavispora lusitaniae ATCC 42720]EEQ40982.1 predicted protein [Clavispora lusitaniae ATCC 42720]